MLKKFSSSSLPYQLLTLFYLLLHQTLSSTTSTAVWFCRRPVPVERVLAVSRSETVVATLCTLPTDIICLPGKHRDMADMLSSPSHRQLWLDRLPEEIRERIATYASRGQQTDSALSLAESSELQRQAVLAVLSFEFVLPKEGTLIRRWSAVFSGRVRKITMGNRYPPLTYTPVQLFEAPTLCSAEVQVSDNPAALRVLSKSTSLREICITIPSWEDCLMELESISKLNLTSLRFICKNGSECVMDRLLQSDRAATALREKVTGLNFACGLDHECPPLQRIRELPALRELVLGYFTVVPNEAVPYLRDLDSVKMISHDWSLSHRIGASLKGLDLRHLRCVASEHFVKLKGCPRLEKLQCQVRDGDEMLLVETVKCLPNMRDLVVTWKSGASAGGAGAEEKLCDVVDGTMLQMVQRLPNLESLRLFNVRVAAKEVRSILEHMGTQLRSFGISPGGRDDADISVVQAILVSLIAYNPEVRQVSLSLDSLRGVPPTIDERLLQRASEVRSLIHLLERSAPLLESGDLQEDAAALTGCD